MNIAVCIKQVPDSETRVRMDSSGKNIDRKDVNLVLNPYDEFAVEEAIKIKEKFGGTTTAITLGPEKAADSLRTAIAMGIDNGIHIRDDANSGFDSYPVSCILAEVLKKTQYDIILFGKQAIDDDNAGVGIEVAEMLGLPHVSVVVKLEIDENNKKAKANRESEGKIEVFECTLPAVFTCQKGLNTPRFAPLMGIMKAKKKELEIIDSKNFTVDKKIEIISLSLKEIIKSGKILTGEVKDTVPQLVKLLHEDAKLI